MNKKKIILSVIFFMILNFGVAQSYSDVDIKSYDYYIAKDWTGLIKYSKSNIDFDEVDYYYLRMRLGSAYFETGNYLKAIKHFKKAVEFNVTDPIAKEYLFYCYKYTFQYTLAKNVYEKMLVKNKKHISPLKNRIFNLAKIEAGINLSENFDKNQDKFNLEEEDIYSETKFIGNTKYFHFGLTHVFSDEFSIYHGISKFNIDNKIKFCLPDGDSIFDYSALQTDYYLNSNYTFPNGLNLYFALHTLSVSFNKPEMKYADFEYSISKPKTEFIDYLLLAGIGNFYNKFYWQAGISYSKINQYNQTQLDFDISWLPFGNYKFVPGIKFVSYQQAEKQEEPSISEIIIEPHLSLSFSSSVWIDVSYTIGNLNNYQEKNGFIIYNNPDRITEKAEALINFKINKNLIFYAKYRFMKREDNSIAYFTEDEYIINSFNFTTNYIIGGISWIF